MIVKMVLYKKAFELVYGDIQVIYTYFALKLVGLLKYVLTIVRELMVYCGSSWCRFFKVSLKTDGHYLD